MRCLRIPLANVWSVQEMKTGLSETSVFAVFHPDAADLFNVCSSLDKVNNIW